MLRNGIKRWRAAGAAVLLALLAGLIGLSGLSPNAVHAKGLSLDSPTSAVSVETVAVAQLPPQGQSMMTLIYQGGPFRYDKDGTVFGNRERILPAKNRGYYHEYTVKTPSERSRGARRIVCGGLKPAAPDACYYTDDHYASFRKIVQ
ncbi:ribonuclease [Polaromonas sp. P1(28)-13]|nr:ribonuclease [Polaromonas sp. P1(28)-13]